MSRLLTVAACIALASVIVMVAVTVRASPVVDESTCVLPSVDEDLLWRLRAELVASPAVPATPFPDGVTGEPHSMPFPPPPGQPIDEATALELHVWFSQLQSCFNAGDVGAVYGTFTEARWRREFNGDSASVDIFLRTLPTGEPTALSDPITSVRLVTAWRIEPDAVVAVTLWQPDAEWITFVLIEAADGWKIDDQWTGQGESFVRTVTPEPTYLVPTPPDPLR